MSAIGWQLAGPTCWGQHVPPCAPGTVDVAWVASPLLRERGRVRDLFKGGTSNPSPSSSPLRPGERRDRALPRFRVWDAGEQGRFPRCSSQSQPANLLRSLRRWRNRRPRTPSRWSLILRAAKAENYGKDKRQKNQTNSKTDAFSEALCEVNRENDIEDRKAD